MKKENVFSLTKHVGWKRGVTHGYLRSKEISVSFTWDMNDSFTWDMNDSFTWDMNDSFTWDMNDNSLVTAI